MAPPSRSRPGGRATGALLPAAALALLLLLLAAPGGAASDDGGEPRDTVIFCNVPGICRKYFGAFPFSGDTTEQVCLEICSAAEAQGEGSTCTKLEDAGGERHWLSVIFDNVSGDNEWRGTVFCDPRGGGGNGR